MHLDLLPSIPDVVQVGHVQTKVIQCDHIVAFELDLELAKIQLYGALFVYPHFGKSEMIGVLDAIVDGLVPLDKGEQCHHHAFQWWRRTKCRLR